MDEEVIKLYASFDDGKLVIERQDSQPITIITHEEVNDNCVEVLEFGSTGNAVKALQALLNCHGQHLEVDGIFGNMTQTALIIYQDEKQIPDQCGICNVFTWNSLIAR